jgi:4-amino-4-deoxy-L-arabinose transferase-like glycosyltransferase
MSRKAWAGLAALYVLTRLALWQRLPYFVDEGSYGRFAQAAAGSLHHLFESLRIGKEPLQAWLAALVIKLGFDPLQALRIISILSGAATVPVAARLGTLLGGRAAAFPAAASAVLLPFLLVNDTIGIVEPLLTLLVTSALWLQIELGRQPRLRTGVALGIVQGLTVLTKQSGEVSVVLLPFCLLCFPFGRPERRERLLRLAGAAGIALALTGVGLLVLRSSSLYGVAAAVRRNPFLYPVHSLSEAIAHPLRWWQLTWPVYRAALSGYVGWPLVATAVVGWLLVARADRRLAALIAMWATVLLLAAILFPVSPYPRHIMYLAPLLCALVGRTVAEMASMLRETLGKRWLGPALTAGAASLLALPALLLDARVVSHPVTAHYPGRDDVQYVTGFQAGSPWPRVVAAIRSNSTAVGPGPVVIAADRADLDVVALLLGHSSRYRFVTAGSSAAAGARFAVADQLPFPSPAGDRQIATGGFRVLERLPRPRGGAVVTLYAR